MGTIPQPLNIPLSKKYYKLVEDYGYRWTHDGSAYRIQVPAGFIYDGASVPRLLWSVFGLRPDGLIRAAALVHDWIYRFAGQLPRGRFQRQVDGAWADVDGGWSRYDTDRLFGRMMRETGVSQFRRRCAFLAVHWFGHSGWGSLQKKIDGHRVDLGTLQTARWQDPDAVRDPIFGLARPIVFAHRGGAKEVPESTRLSFDHAVRCGAGVLEIDVELTRDGQMVLWHGPHLDKVDLPGVGRSIEERLSRRSRNIWQWEWKALRKATVDWPAGVEPWELEDAGDGGGQTRRLMRLETFFDYLEELEERHNLERPIPANIELEGRRGLRLDRSRFLSGDRMKRFVEVLDRRTGEREIVVAAVDSRTLKCFRRELQQPGRSSDRVYATNLSITGQLLYSDRLRALRVLSWISGCAPFLRLLRTRHSLSGGAFQTSHALVTRSLAREAHRPGGAVHVFLSGFPMTPEMVTETTTDGELKQALIGLIDKGVDGVMTDYPKRVVRLLDEVFRDRA